MNGKIEEEWGSYLAELRNMNVEGMLEAVQSAQDRFQKMEK